MNEAAGGSKKGLLVLVTLAALVVWGGVVYRLTGGAAAPDAGAADTVHVRSGSVAEEARTAVPTLAYRGVGRDPFRLPIRSAAQPDSMLAPKGHPRLSPPPFTLRGIVGGTALLAASGDTMHFVREGQAVGPYRLIIVGQERVVLARAGHRDTLRLYSGRPR